MTSYVLDDLLEARQHLHRRVLDDYREHAQHSWVVVRVLQPECDVVRQVVDICTHQFRHSSAHTRLCDVVHRCQTWLNETIR